MEPSVFTPQVWSYPASTSVNVLTGGVLWPELLSPQQAMVALVFSPQV
jgi:hypothetical protein